MNRRAWILVALGYAILALGFLSVTIWLDHQQSQLDAQVRVLQDNQKQIKINQFRAEANAQRILRLTLLTSATICLEAVAPEKDEADLVRQFIRSGGQIDLSDDPLCERGVRIAQDIVAGRIP